MIYNWKCIGSKILVALLALVVSGCEKAAQFDKDKPYQQVLLFYLGTDNNLSREGYQKLEALKSGWKKQKDYEILVYMDAANAKPQLLRLDGMGGQELLQEYEENAADPTVLRQVIDRMTSAYPAQAYGLVLFSHASGWLPRKTLLQPNRLPATAGVLKTRSGALETDWKDPLNQTIASVVIDGEAEMELVDLAKAIPDHTFRFIAFEACFMAGIEVAYELRRKTDYLLASSAEILSPGFAEIYRPLIQTLATDTESGLKTFAQGVFDYWNQQQGDLQSATLSIIRSDELEPLAEWIRANGLLAETVVVTSIQHFDRYSYRLFFDFEDYFSRLMPTEAHRRELQARVAQAVVWKAATKNFMPYYNGFTIHKHSGLTVYIQQSAFPNLNQAYQKLQWFQDTQVHR